MDELQEAVATMVKNLQAKGISPNGAEDVSAQGEGLQEEESEASSFLVNNALKYMEEHYQEKLKLQDVADQVYVSQWHLSKLLNRYKGQSFSDILNNIRIEKAKELLNDPALRIGDIAEKVGFLDMAHFSRVFKRQTGMSANEFRNNLK
jgi:YesN/AraC family two-component response regulator